MRKTRTLPTPNTSALLALRKALGLSQQQVADRGNITRDVVRMNERGARKLSSFQTRFGFAKGLGLSLDELNELVDGVVDADELAERVRAREPALRQESETPAVR